jgi:hypothetical protein
MTPACKRCQDTGWVYERHLDRPLSNELPPGFEFVVPCPDCRAHVSQKTRRIRCNSEDFQGVAKPTPELPGGDLSRGGRGRFRTG